MCLALAISASFRSLNNLIRSLTSGMLSVDLLFELRDDEDEVVVERVL